MCYVSIFIAFKLKRNTNNLEIQKCKRVSAFHKCHQQGWKLPGFLGLTRILTPLHFCRVPQLEFYWPLGTFVGYHKKLFVDCGETLVYDYNLKYQVIPRIYNSLLENWKLLQCESECLLLFLEDVLLSSWSAQYSDPGLPGLTLDPFSSIDTKALFLPSTWRTCKKSSIPSLITRILS